MAQDRKSRTSETDDESTADTAVDPAAAERKEQLDEDVDAILDDIDEVLETNPEEFVRSYVQKGGQ